MQDKEYKPVEIFQMTVVANEIVIRINPECYSFAKVDRFLKLVNNEFNPDNTAKTNK